MYIRYKLQLAYAVVFYVSRILRVCRISLIEYVCIYSTFTQYVLRLQKEIAHKNHGKYSLKTEEPCHAWWSREWNTTYRSTIVISFCPIHIFTRTHKHSRAVCVINKFNNSMVMNPIPLSHWNVYVYIEIPFTTAATKSQINYLQLVDYISLCMGAA